MTLDPIAVEAAAKAMCEIHGRKWDVAVRHGTDDWWREEANAALTAYFASLRERGVLVEAQGYGDKRHMGADSKWQGGFPVVIIRLYPDKKGD